MADDTAQAPGLRANQGLSDPHLCEDWGFNAVRTYINSGNVVFHADDEEVEIQSRLQTALKAHVGRPFGVLLRSAAEMAAVLASNPFSTGAPNLVHATFLKGAPPKDVLAGVCGGAGEEIAPG